MISRRDFTDLAEDIKLSRMGAPTRMVCGATAYEHLCDAKCPKGSSYVEVDTEAGTTTFFDYHGNIVETWVSKGAAVGPSATFAGHTFTVNGEPHIPKEVVKPLELWEQKQFNSSKFKGKKR